MNHSQAKAPLQMETAMQAVYQFLSEQGFVSTVEMLAEESGIPNQPETLSNTPSTLLTALSLYENQREMAFKVKKPDAEFQTIQAWLGALRESPEQYVTYEYRNLQTHTANVICCKFQPKRESSLFAAGSFNKSIAICSAESNTVLRRVNASGPVLSLHFNPVHPNLLLATCMNGGHTIIDVEKDEEQAVLQSRVDHKKYVVAGKWSPNGTHYVTGSHDGSLHVYGPAAASGEWQLVGRVEYPSNVEAVEWVDAERFYVAVREDNYIHVLQLDGVKEVATLNTNEYGDDHVSFNVLDMALSPGGKTILLATDRHRAILLQTGSSHQVRNFYNVQNDGYSTPRLSWSPCGKFAYVSCQDKCVRVLDVASGQIVHTLTGHEINVRDVSVHPFKNQLLSCSFDKSCRVWTTEVE